jgi:hypothetical protein
MAAVMENFLLMLRFASSTSAGPCLSALLIAASVLLMSVSATGLSSTVIAKSGPQKKKIEKHATTAKEPIEIVGVTIRDTIVVLGKEFDGEGDWLAGLKLKIRNKSDEPIVWIGINLLFPETRITGPVMLDQLFIGQRPDMRTKEPPLDLKPGEELEVSVESHLESMRAVLRKKGRFDSLDHLDINIDEVMFSDGTLYSGDAIWKPNPDTSSPRKWIKISPE